MATLTIPNSFIAATVILSAEVNANFNAVATFLNTTKINFDNIQDSGVTTVKIADGAITTVKILDANVTTDKIADSNVTTAKIADGNVTTAKILDANVTEPKLSAALAARIFSRQEVQVNTAASTGSVGIYAMAFSNVELNTGTDITYTPSALNGDSWTVNTAGVYAISYTGNGVVGDNFAITRNASPTATASSAAAANRLAAAYNVPSLISMAWTGLLAVNDVIRAHKDNTSTGTADRNRFGIVKVVS